MAKDAGDGDSCRSTRLGFRCYHPTMRPMHFNVSAEPTADGFIAHCRELEISCEGATEDEARRNVIEAITLLFDSGPLGELDVRLPEPSRVKQIDVRLHE